MEKKIIEIQRKLYLEAAGGKSKLITYEGADHFFSHDSRFFEKLIQDISDFI
jgi:alpha/beta superfamily hydrolase